MSDEHKLIAFELARRGWGYTQIAQELGHAFTTIQKLFEKPASSYAIPVPASSDWKLRIERACVSNSMEAA